MTIQCADSRTALPYLQAVRLAVRDLSIRVKDLRILHNKKHTGKSSVVKENLLLLQRKDLGSQHPQLTIISNSSYKGSSGTMHTLKVHTGTRALAQKHYYQKII